MTEDEELLVREWLTGKVAAAVLFDRVAPAPVFFVDRADYLATVLGDQAPETVRGIEQAHVAFACVYLKTPFDDDPTTAPHSPLTVWGYECYMFSETDPEREDEDALTPDAFDRLTLKRHNEFVASVVRLKDEFQGETAIAGLTGYTTAQTLPLAVREEVQNDTECEFVRGVRGTSARFGLNVRLQKEDC